MAENVKAFPDLIYRNGPSDKRVFANVFFDLKLDRLLSKAAIEIMQVPCTGDDIALRQDFFKQLLNKDKFNNLFELLNSVSAMNVLNYNLKTAATRAEKYYIFYNLANEYIKFVKQASQTKIDCFLFRRFKDYFFEVASSYNFQKFENEVEEIKKKIGNFPIISYSVTTEKISACGTHKKALTDSLSDVCKSMNFSISEQKKEHKYSLSFGMIDCIALLHEEEYLLLHNFKNSYSTFFDRGILKYKDELDFLLSITELVMRIKNASIPITFAQICVIK